MRFDEGYVNENRNQLMATRSNDDSIVYVVDDDSDVREGLEDLLDSVGLKKLRTRFDGLSERERQIMGLVTTGLMNKHIAGEIGVSEVTVKVHRHNVMKKLGAGSLADLVRFADLLGVPRRRSRPL
jgi:FixJ family two-component response regulator